MKIDQLYKNLKASQGKKGNYFNKDKDLVFELLEALILNKERYGYMACPCRLACGEREKDKDII
ncbi:MAG: ferredoxin:thioredoxin reductase, partial [Desulfobacteraceae bacterium]|nr:ferredoxin:thioredoxin reductase [Desulfobacteraceae bacterium]